MRLIKRILIGIGVIIGSLVLVIAIQYLWHGDPASIQYKLYKTIVAHRGVHMNYRKGVYDRKTGCEAVHIFPPTHHYIDNTLESIGAAFLYGAAIVEIDIRKTADNNLVIFHDFMLECRTDGKGLVAEHDVPYLRKLDIGYGYTADGGKSFPFRGKGLGLMPTLDEVLTEFHDKVFLIDHKDWDTESMEILIRILGNYPAEQRSRLYVWTGPDHLKTIQSAFPEINPFFLLYQEAKTYFIPFLVSFGLLRVPEEFRGRVIAIPARYVRYVWGWPYRFIDSVHKSGLEFYLMLDTEEDARKFKDIPVDGYITDFIEIVGKELHH